MASNYLNNLNNIIKINSSMISNGESKDALVALSRRNSEDLNRIADYINSLVVPAVSSLASKVRYPYDSVESGISGLTVVTFPEAQGNNRFNSELFWMKGPTEETGRPCTIKESFDYLLANMIDRVVEVRESVADLNPLLEQVICANTNLIKVATDSFGIKYIGQLNCTTDPILTYPLAEHIYQIIRQLTGNSVADELATGANSYPNLNIPGVANATEINKGISEIATVKEIALGSDINSSDTNSELTVTSDRLLLAISSDDANGSLTAPEVNSLRNSIKDIADDRIAASDIGALANVDETNAIPGSVLVYNSDSKWVVGSVDSNTTLGTRSQAASISDVQNDGYMDNGSVVVYDHKLEKNTKASAYEVFGLNFNYYKSIDDDWTKTVGIPISTNLKNKGIPFVFKCAPKFEVFNTTYISTVNASPLFGQSLENYFNPSFDKAKEISFYQNSCSVWDTASTSHKIEPKGILGVCRSDINYGKTWIQNTNDSVEPEYNTFMNSFNGFECIQEAGTSKVMVLGPYNLGDEIFLCPGKILDLAGISNNLGIGISSTFLFTSVKDLTLGSVNVNESLFELLYREPLETCVTISEMVMVRSKSLGVITSDITFGENKSLSPINDLCYSLVESTYDGTASNDLIQYFQTEILEIDNTALTHPEFIENIHQKVSVLSLPLVKLTI